MFFIVQISPSTLKNINLTTTVFTLYFETLLGAGGDVSSDLADVTLSASVCARVCTLPVDAGLVRSAVLVPGTPA